MACISEFDTSEKENPPIITVPSGEKFFLLSSIRRNARPLAVEGVLEPRSPTSLIDSTRTTRFRYRSGLSCVTVTFSVHRPAVIRSRDDADTVLRLSCVVVKTRCVVVSSSEASRPIETVKRLLPDKVAPTPDTAVPTGFPELSSHWIV